MSGDGGLSPEARELEARVRDAVASLTDVPAPVPPPPRPRPWHKGGEGRAWTWLAFGLLLVFAFLALFEVFDDDGPGVGAVAADSSAEADEASSFASPAGGRWHFTADEGGSGLYTIDLLGDGSSGPIDVIEDRTDVGTYAWNQSALTIEFTRVLTLPDGFAVKEPSSFACTGTPEMESLSCTYERQMWTYDPRTGLSVEGASSSAAHGARQQGTAP